MTTTWPGVRGVGADLLVAGLARVDDEVATARDRRPERDPGEDRPVLERQQRRTQIADARVDDRGGSRRRGHDHATATSTGRARAGQQMTHPPQGRGGRGRARTSEPPSPASRDRYASLTGPAMKGRRQGSIRRGPAGRRVARSGATRPRSSRVGWVVRLSGEPEPMRDGRRLHPVRHPELAQDVRDVDARRLAGDEQRRRRSAGSTVRPPPAG